MSVLALAMFLTVTQAAPPVPRQTIKDHREKAETKAQIPQNGQQSTAPSPPNASVNAPTETNTAPKSTENKAYNTNPSAPKNESWSRGDKLSLVYDIETGLLVIIGGFGVCFALRTLKAIERQTKATEIAANAARDSANVADRTLKETQKQFSISHRPWVTVSGEIETGLLIFDDASAKVTVSFVLKNGGTSPALETTNVNQGLIFGSPPKTPEDTRKVISCGREEAFLPAGFGILILPNDTHTVKQLLLQTRQGQVASSSQEVWFTICVRYKDEHGNSHGTGLLWRFVSDEGKRMIEPRGAVKGTFERIGVGNESY